MNIDINNRDCQVVWQGLQKIMKSLPILNHTNHDNINFNYYVSADISRQGIESQKRQNELINIFLKNQIVTEFEERDESIVQKGKIKSMPIIIYHFRTTDKFTEYFNKYKKAFEKIDDKVGNRLEYEVNNGILSAKFITCENKEFTGRFSEGNRTYELMMFLINKKQKTIVDKPFGIKLINKTIFVSCPPDWRELGRLTSILKSAISDIRKEFGINLGIKRKMNDSRKKFDIVTGDKWQYVLNVESIICKKRFPPFSTISCFENCRTNLF